MTERLLLPIPEAHWQVGVGRSKFYEYVAAGEIEIVKVGRRTLVPQESLRAFVDRLRASQTAAEPSSRRSRCAPSSTGYAPARPPPDPADMRRAATRQPDRRLTPQTCVERPPPGPPVA